jgi:hypothetical protein
MKLYGKKDIMINDSYDIVLSWNGGKIDATPTVMPEDHLIQSIMIALRTKKREFVFNQRLGASPITFMGRTMNASLFPEIENYISVQLKESGVLYDGFPIQVLSAPLDPVTIAIRVSIALPARMENIDFLYDINMDTVSPLTTGFR